MEGDYAELSRWVASTGLLTLRLVPTFAFAPPFTLAKAPRVFGVLLSMGLAMALVSAMPEARLTRIDSGVLVLAAVREFTLGLVPVVVLQLLFGSLFIVGRTIDMQSGFGLALLIDPASRAQVPLVGTLFAYAASASFFALEGHWQIYRFFAASLKLVPVGQALELAAVGALASYAATIMLVALGVGGAAIVALFLADLVVAMLSRTVPQMNALLLGIQVKAGLMLLVVPIALGAAGALFAHMVALALEALPKVA